MDNGHVTPLGCPEPAELIEFRTGNLSGPVLERIAAHVEQCSVCETALDALDDQTDSFLSRLQLAALTNTPADEPVPAELLAAAWSCRDQPIEGPRRLGKFELLEELGLGSFGHVFRAHDTELGRIVAIKVLRAGRLASREEVDCFLGEAAAPRLSFSIPVSSRHPYEIGENRRRSVLPRRRVR